MEKSDIIEMAREYVCPGKIDAFGQIGIDLVIGKREGPYIFDIDGKRLIDLHINGGVFNLGHRHPELIEILSQKKTAAVIMETIPATYGFPLPEDGYLKSVRELCHKYR